MKKHRFFAVCLLFLLSISALAAGEAYSFPRAGVRADVPENWMLVTRDTLATYAGELSGRGIDVRRLRLDMEAGGAVFAVFIGDVRVTLSRHENEQTVAWRSIPEMPDEDKAALFDGFSALPYQNTEWSQGDGSCLLFDWALQSDGEEKQFSGAAVVAEGALYQLTATGAAPAEALREAAVQTLSALSMFVAAKSENTSPGIAAFAPIEDDGVVTPLDLIGFTGVSYEDYTELIIQTQPGANVLVITANDKLRAVADGEGVRSFRVSTRREMAYSYTIQVSAQDRTASQAQIVVNRQLSPELKTEAYQKSARPLDHSLYGQLLSDPADFTDTAVAVRGKVARFEEQNGFPCALIHSNAADGELGNPVFVALFEPFDISEGFSYTVYGDVLGETMPLTNDDGIETEVPVIRARSVVQ